MRRLRGEVWWIGNLIRVGVGSVALTLMLWLFVLSGVHDGVEPKVHVMVDGIGLVGLRFAFRVESVGIRNAKRREERRREGDTGIARL